MFFGRLVHDPEWLAEAADVPAGIAAAARTRLRGDQIVFLRCLFGLPIVLLFALALFALQRGSKDKERLLPLFVLLCLMVVVLMSTALIRRSMIPLRKLQAGQQVTQTPRARAVRSHRFDQQFPPEFG